MKPVLTVSFLRRLHGDERGSMSIVSVFAVILLAMLLGMVINVGRHTDRKVKLQNAADSAAISGGVVLARGMNTLAFTNHLLCDVFGMTAYLREARERNAESLTGPVLESWEQVASLFSDAPFPKFAELGDAIAEKVPLERQMIQGFGDENAAAAEQYLLTFELILQEEMIPNFQRALIQNTPRLASTATDEVAQRHGNASIGLSGPDTMHGLLWRTIGDPVGGNSEMDYGTIPAVDPSLDPSPDQHYLQIARQQRHTLSHRYLRELNNRALVDFDRYAKMSQFGGLWRGFTCGQLEKLLDQYSVTNLPHVIRDDSGTGASANAVLERDYMFVGVVYWQKMPERLPGLFQNPLDADDTAFAQVYLRIPRARLKRIPDPPWWVNRPMTPYWWLYRQSRPQQWDLLNQYWSVQLVPATSESIPGILETTLPGAPVSAPNLGGITTSEFRRINTH